jgi:hypothetical protein
MTVQLKSDTTTNRPMVVFPSQVAFSMAKERALAKRGVKERGFMI